MIQDVQKLSRGETLAEAFFFRMDQELIDLLGKKLNREESIQAIQELTGIVHREVIESLVDAGWDSSAAAAFIWAPIVFVAWADGHADEAEKKAIIELLEKKGFPTESAKLLMDHPWFQTPPSDHLWNLWKEFATNFLNQMKPADRQTLVRELIELCQTVAQASGGFMGLGSVSQSESAAIAKVEHHLV
ncbi:hypothetical protein SH449x_000909 [Pirellulaceae bacterium SH449]